MMALTFVLHLKEPLLMTTIEGDPNSAISLPYVPGSTLRGALIARYLDDRSVRDLAVHAEARRLFFDGPTRYLNAYPVDRYQRRTLPTPRAWKKRKGDRGQYEIFDLSLAPRPIELEGGQPKPVSQPFCQLTGPSVALYDVDKQINIHTLRDPEAGRALGDGQGAVFRYEALAPGQTLAGVILCKDLEGAEILQALLERDHTLILGGSQSAGYGLLKVEEVSIVDGWSEATHDLTPRSNKYLTVTLLSDAILRNTAGQYTGFLTPEILAEHLGITLTLDRAQTFTEIDVVGGFNRKWGLPLPQTPVTRAGSVFTFEVSDLEIPIDRLEELVQGGIGERTVEGFGRVAVNWHARHAKLRAHEVDERKRTSATVPTLTGDSARLAQTMAERMLRRRLDTALRERVLKVRVRGDIRNTQLSAIRTLVRTALATREVDPILDYLEQMKSTGQQQFEQAKIDGKQADRWLRTVLKEKPSAIWERLYRTSFDPEEVPVVGGVRADWRIDLAREYALRLVDGVLSRELARRRKGAA